MFDFLLAIQLPPISTLLPYTTLFRSVARFARERISDAAAGGANVAGGAGALIVAWSTVGDRSADADPAARIAHAGDALRLDRKSTRLNSSHGYISYAVFCLKKKNTDY